MTAKVYTTRALPAAPVSPITIASGALIVLGASIPIATALDTLLVAIIAVAWIAAARFRETLNVVRTNPVASVACLWLLVYILGATYSRGASEDIWRSLTKAATFLLIPMAAVLLKDAQDIRRAHLAFMAAVGLTILLSYLRWAGMLPDASPLLKDAGYSVSVVFKYHLTQNLMVAYGSFVFAVYARVASSRNTRFLLGTCAVLGTINVLVVGDGRTGHVILLVLAVYYGAWCGGKRGVAAAVMIAAVSATAAYLVPGSSLHNRVELAISDFAQWRPGVQGKPSGVTERLEFQRRGMRVFSEHPVFGVGSGGFAAADRELALQAGLPPARHPHNEYLLKAVELGIFGPLLMLLMFAVQWRQAPRLAEPTHTALARGLVLMYAVGSFGTSMLRDHSEALLFVWMTAVLFSGWRPRAERVP
jgi:O-antigen ligase